MVTVDDQRRMIKERKKIGNVYSSEYTHIPKVFFTSRYIRRCCTDVIRGHCCVLGYSCTNVIPGHAGWVPRLWRLLPLEEESPPPPRLCTLSTLVETMTPPVMQVEYPCKNNNPGHSRWYPRDRRGRQTDMSGTMKVLFAHARAWRTPSKGRIQEMHSRLCWPQNLKVRDYLGDQSVNGRIAVKLIL
jgi:hypothetical protein